MPFQEAPPGSHRLPRWILASTVVIVLAVADLAAAAPQRSDRGPVVWREGEEIVATAGRLVTMAELAAWMHDIARRNPAHADRDARHFERRIGTDLRCQLLWVHAAPAVRRLLRAGDLQVTLQDGRTVRDAGFLLYPPPADGGPPQDSDAGGVVLLGRDDPQRRGRMMYLFLPAGEGDDRIVRVQLAPRER